MKHIYFFLIIFCSCAPKDRSSEIAPKVGASSSTPVWSGPRNQYENEIDVMVAFIWPTRITTADQRDAVRDVISTSRKLKPLKDEYLAVKTALDLVFRSYDCDCALNGQCQEGDDQSQVNECSRIEEEISTNALKLAEFYELVERIKAKIEAARGEWIATNTEYPLVPPSSLNLSDLSLQLNVFGEDYASGESHPISYGPSKPQITLSGAYPRLKWSFPASGRDTPGTWSIDVLMVETSGDSLIFQGDLRLDKDGQKRHGVIQWEQLRKMTK